MEDNRKVVLTWTEIQVTKYSKIYEYEEYWLDDTIYPDVDGHAYYNEFDSNSEAVAFIQAIDKRNYDLLTRSSLLWIVPWLLMISAFCMFLFYVICTLEGITTYGVLYCLIPAVASVVLSWVLKKTIK